MIKKIIKITLLLMVIVVVFVNAQDKRKIIVPEVVKNIDIMEDRWIGISGRDVEQKDLEKYQLNEIAGVIIVQISENSPASKTDLREGDVILEYDGQKVMSIKALKRMVLETPLDRKVSLKIFRDGKIIKTEISVEKKRWEFEIPDIRKWFYRENEYEKDERCPECVYEEKDCIKLGIELNSLNKQLRKYFNAPENAGVLVANVYKDSLAERNGLKVGDVIVKINDQEISKPYQISEILCSIDYKEMLNMVIIRDKKEMTLFIDFKPIKK